MVSGRLLDLGHDLARGIAEIVGGDDRETRVRQYVLALLHVGALEADDQRHRQIHFLGRRDDPLGDDVAAHDAAEDVDQDALHGGIAEDDLERRGHLLGGRAAADVEEVGGEHAVELDDVHRRHREAGAVDHAADIAVELDVGEVIFGRLDLGRILLGLVAEREDVLVAEQRVGIERHLGVEHEQFLALGHDQRVDLEHRHVGGEEGLVKLPRELLRLLGEIAGELEPEGDGAAVVGHEALGGIDRDRLDALGRVVRDRLDVHAALGRDDHGDPAGRTIDQHRQIEFLVDVGPVGDVEAVDLLAMLAGLRGDQRVTEHVGRGGANLVERLGQPNAALGVGAEFLELTLAAAARVDLRLHHIHRPGQRAGGGDRLVDRHRSMSRGHGDAEFREQFLGLIFVDVHDSGRSDGWRFCVNDG